MGMRTRPIWMARIGLAAIALIGDDEAPVVDQYAEGVHGLLEQLPPLEQPRLIGLLGVVQRQQHVGRNRQPHLVLLFRLIDALRPVDECSNENERSMRWPSHHEVLRDRDEPEVRVAAQFSGFHA
nr:hypothetical protein [Deltaproteobacteria bacterium]